MAQMGDGCKQKLCIQKCGQTACHCPIQRYHRGPPTDLYTTGVAYCFFRLFTVSLNSQEALLLQVINGDLQKTNTLTRWRHWRVWRHAFCLSIRDIRSTISFTHVLPRSSAIQYYCTRMCTQLV